MSYAAVFPLVRTRAFSGAFDYLVPPELAGRIAPGALVAVPLGAQTVIGVVLEVRGETAHEGRVLPVRDLLDVPGIPPDLLELARRIEVYYLTSFAAALTLVCPPTGALKVVRQYELTKAGEAARAAGESDLDEVAGLKLPAGPLEKLAARYRRKGWVRISYRVHVAGAAPASRALRRGEATPQRLGARQRAALAIVEREGVVGERELRAACGIGLSGLRRLLDTGVLPWTSRHRSRRPGRLRRRPPPQRLTTPCRSSVWLPQPRLDGYRPARRWPTCPNLLPEQRRTLHAVLCEARGGDEVLVHGVTGSGKTEVYLQAAQSALERGRSVLFLVPEIGLTGQTVARVRERFVGQDVAVLHSGLTARERLLAYRAVASGDTRIVVGARSAVFAPLRDIGLIIVDEEHDTSFKQESEPAYDARTVARWRAESSGAVVVLGSATPSVESYARVPLHADLRLRVDGSQPPSLEIVDMRDHHGVFSAQLAQALVATVDAGDKAILFLNRRGFASFLVCDHCGFTWMCPRCDVTLTLFGGRGLRCRTCGHAEAAPSACPSCGSADLVRHGFGTERVEREVRGAPARGRPAAPRLGRGILLRAPSRRARPLRRARRACPRRHPDDRQRPPLPGRDARRRRQCGPHAALPGLPCRRAHLRDAPSGRGAQRARRAAGARDRPDAEPRGPADRLCGQRGGGAFLRRGGRAPSGARLPAFRHAHRPSRCRDRRKRRSRSPDASPRSGSSPTCATASRCSGRGRCGVSAGGPPAGSWLRLTDSGKTLDTLRRWLGANRDRFAERGVRLVPDVDPQWL